jgi:hypothetical protein
LCLKGVMWILHCSFLGTFQINRAMATRHMYSALHGCGECVQSHTRRSSVGFIGKSIPSVHKPTQELLIIFPLYFSVSSCLECRVTAVLYIKRFLSRHSFKNAMRYLQPHDFSDLLDIFCLLICFLVLVQLS